MSTPPYLSESHSDDNGKMMVMAVAALLVVTSLVLLIHVYAKWWFLMQSRGRRSSSSIISDIPDVSQIQRVSVTLDDHIADVSDGLDDSVVASLPIFIYNSDEYKSAVECVICLTTLVDDDKGRILPKCQHLFHVGCIDMWLHSHSTCPICRARVVPVESMVVVSVGSVEVSHDPPQTSDESIVIADENSRIVLAVDIPIDSNLENQLSKDSSACSSLSSSSPSSSSSSLGSSLKRMLSRNRSESKVFPSVQVSES